MVPHDPPGRLVEVVGARVVSRALPDLQDPAHGSPCEVLDAGKLRNEAREVPRRRRDARLLEEYLGNPDMVRDSVSTPRKRTTVAAEPPEKDDGDFGGK
jgi:hypothetical protein